MQRYSVYSSSIDPFGFEIKPQDDGCWVNADEAMSRIAELEESLKNEQEASARNDSINIEIIHKQGERIAELEKELEFFKQGFKNAADGKSIEWSLAKRDLEVYNKGYTDCKNGVKREK